MSNTNSALALLAALGLMCLASNLALADRDDEIALALSQRFLVLYEAGGAMPAAEVEALQVFYEERGLTLQWFGRDVPTGRAEALLATLAQAGWDQADLEAEIDEGRNKAIRLPKAVRIYLTYSTAWVDDAGIVQFREDIYGRDAALTAALAE